MKNDFEEMCIKLHNRSGKCIACVCTNEFICAYEAVKLYVCNDRRRLLKLKADMQRYDVKSLAPTYISVTTLIVTMFTLMATISANYGIVYGATAFAGAFVYMLYIIYKMHEKQYITDWGEYISVAIEELSKEL